MPRKEPDRENPDFSTHPGFDEHLRKLERFDMTPQQKRDWLNALYGIVPGCLDAAEAERAARMTP